MNFRSILGFFAGIAKRAFNLAKDSGLTDELVGIALKWVRATAKQNIDNPAKRALVVKILTGRGVPEGIARIAVELAYLAYKDEIEPKLNPQE